MAKKQKQENWKPQPSYLPDDQKLKNFKFNLPKALKDLKGDLTIKIDKGINLRGLECTQINLKLKPLKVNWKVQVEKDNVYHPATLEEINNGLKSLGIKQKFGDVVSFPLTIETKNGTKTEEKQVKVLWYDQKKKEILVVGKDIKNPKENHLYTFKVKDYKKVCKPVKAEDVQIDIKVEFVPAWQNRAIKNIELSTEFKKDFEKAMKEYYLEKLKKLKETLSDEEYKATVASLKEKNLFVLSDELIEGIGENGDASAPKKPKKPIRSKN